MINKEAVFKKAFKKLYLDKIKLALSGACLKPRIFKSHLISVRKLFNPLLFHDTKLSYQSKVKCAI